MVWLSRQKRRGFILLLAANIMWSFALSGCFRLFSPVVDRAHDADGSGDGGGDGDHIVDGGAADAPGVDGGNDGTVVVDGGPFVDGGNDGGIVVDGGPFVDGGNDGGIVADGGPFVDGGNDGGIVADSDLDAGEPPVTVGWIQTLGFIECSDQTVMSVTVPAGIAVEVGDTIVLRFGARGISLGPFTASDTQGNTYTVDHTSRPSGSNYIAALLSATVTTALGGGDIITLNRPPEGSAVLTVEHLSEVSATHRVVGVGASFGDSTTPSVAVTVELAPAVVMGVVAMWNDHPLSVGSEWTPLGSYFARCAAPPWPVTSQAAVRLINSTGELTYSATSSAPDKWAAVAVAYGVISPP
jgi:hypothetical protein